MLRRLRKSVVVTTSFPCVCCGHLTLDEPPGSSAICPVCLWEDDLVQLRWPTRAGGANAPCLIEAQRSFQMTGASEVRWSQHVRPARDDEPFESGWSAVNYVDPAFEVSGDEDAGYPEDLTQLYWWRPTFWRKDAGI